MTIANQPWEIHDFLQEAANFNLNPKYQRLPVWKGTRKPLLIDSILRGYDLPKFYVTVLSQNPNRYEVTDGQQRLRTIIEFFENGFALLPDTIVDGIDVSRIRYSALPQTIKERFLRFTLSFSEILNAQQGEVNELFIRLQKGVELNPVELRHAMFSNLGFAIDDLLLDTHVAGFFNSSKIPIGRFKHQDYLDHAIAASFFGDTRDLKAEAMYELYKEYAVQDITPFNRHFRNAKRILRKMTEINEVELGVFKNKWSFVDAFRLLLENIQNIGAVNPSDFATLFKEFNEKRVEYRKEPEIALRSRRLGYGRELYDYINAFEKEAANRESLRIRKAALKAVFIEMFESEPREAS
ncbi:MAG: hypothetical protein JWP69_1684 [Flaviaesturariibacter sp.]|nr:hypothetical protein [Flaviaesturariibacter sp.]